LHQLQNASLAIHLARRFIELKKSEQSEELSSSLWAKALENTRWPGRCQTVSDPQDAIITWFLDGAHTAESLDCSMQWFVSPEAILKPQSSV